MSAVTASLCSTLMFVLFVSADQKTITAESGQDVTLTCRAPNNNITVVEWSRADLGDEYVLVYRDGRPLDNQHPSFKNRVDLQDRQMKDGDVSLILKDVMINDTGTYKCRVFMRETRSWKSISIITLTVVPPGQTGGHKEDGGKKEDGSVGLILGLSVAAVLLLLVAAVVVVLIYRKRKQNSADPDKEGLLEPLQHEYQENVTAESGQDVTLTCQALNNNIRAVKWSRADLKNKHVLLYRNGKFVSNNQHPSFKNRVDLQDRQMKDGDVSLILKDVSTDDDGSYKCHVLMRETRSWKSISIITLTVVPPVQRNITAESGQDVTLTCRAPNNNISSVQWGKDDLEACFELQYKDGQFLLANQHPSFKNRVDLQDRQMKDGNVSLILKDVTINDTGTYECLVFMEETEKYEQSIINLHVVPPDQKEDRMSL
ncbi:uncharacterized protein LOC120437675 isoform X3 [Oreochromis aureus]|uniref:Ig-like domain-containing protein n=1 Tax=Oreochromis aureus TaxID=47969 RepID=A0AAZ1X805_OREAU|nr:uncharacterized protein LOC120437675 isoform X2 [Oreochromis aureus]XP_039464131.1 uncharacterized protein LOC120437675 isoform X3 [Oreochromis aureus]